MLTCASFSFPPGHHHQPQAPTFSRKKRISIIKNKKITSDIKAIHTPTIRRSLLVFNLLLQFYASSGLMREARTLFDEMPEKTLFSWTRLMSGYARHGPAIETLSIFRTMLQQQDSSSPLQLAPDSFVYSIVLRACADAGYLNYGRELHCRILRTRVVIDSFVENALVTMYASSNCLRCSVSVFYGIQQPDLVSWSCMLSGYVRNGHEEDGLRIFCEMGRSGIRPDVFAFSIVIGASANLGCIDFGIQIHCCMIKKGFDSSLFLENSLMDFYARCGDFGASKRVFDEMPERNLVSWNTIITGCVRNLCNYEALAIFRELMHQVSSCDEFTLASILQAVASLEAPDHGREIHGYLIRAGFEANAYVISALMNMYVKCANSERSHRYNKIPLKVFHSLQGRSRSQRFYEFTVASILKWCALLLDLETGKMLHSCIIKLKMKSDPYVISSLIDMYAKCGIIEAARWVFMGIQHPGTVSWSAVIAGHCQKGWFQEAMRLFRRMQLECVEANEFTYTSVILASTALVDLKMGKELHCNILRNGYGSNVSVINTLINLYSELGHPHQALKLSYSIPENRLSWGILIQACTKIKDHEMNLEIFLRIQQCHGNLDPISACRILSSCANPFLLSVGTQAQAYFLKRGLVSEPNISNSLIKMYSGSGRITDAVKAFNGTAEKNSTSWTAVISANADYGESSEALHLFTQMCQKNKSPNADTFTSVLKACGHMGLVDEAFSLFVSMDEKYGIKPSVEHYSCMVEVLGRTGMFKDALEFINSVIPFEPNAQIWRTLLSSCRIHGNMGVAKYAAEKLLALEPSDFAANLLLEQVLLTVGRWGDASKLKTKNKSIRESCSWIEIRNNVHEFVSRQSITEEVSAKLAEMEGKMEELGYVADKNHWLHNAEEGYGGNGVRHTEITAVAFGLISLPHGAPIRVVKGVRMCGDCHSVCKFISTFIGRDLVVKDSCKFHQFRYGKCSCRDSW